MLVSVSWTVKLEGIFELYQAMMIEDAGRRA